MFLPVDNAKHKQSRRSFLQTSSLAASSLLLSPAWLKAAETKSASSMSAADLPKGSAPRPVATPHFPDRLHAFVWRNWSLVPVEKMAAVLGASKADILHVGYSMGLPRPPRISRDQQRRSYITVIKRNWHLLLYEQLLALLDWTPDRMAFTLREDDFLYHKLGNVKPHCEPLRFEHSDSTTTQRAEEISRIVRKEFPDGLEPKGEPLFHFVSELSKPPPETGPQTKSRFSPRFCYSYFALYGDPLLEPDADPYPEGYLAHLSASGVDCVWLPGVLYKLAPFPWNAKLSERYEERLHNLAKLVARAQKHGLNVRLYLNEPRSMPMHFFVSHPELKGVVEGDNAALCTSRPEVQQYLTQSITTICHAVPDLAGFFTITGSENLTNCWSHGGGKGCPRCSQRPPADVIAEVNRALFDGIRKAGSQTDLIVWDWGWNDAWAEDIIRQLPGETSLMSVSEWGLPIERGGVKSNVGEYSISSVGPGPRATRHWKIARECGLKTIAKIQAGNTWELSAVPYIPAVQNVARHAANLRAANVDGLMLGWTLGGYPSPNLEVVAEIAASQSGNSISPEKALLCVAEHRFGKAAAPTVVTAWNKFSTAFSEFPFHTGVVYSAPLQVGPSNLLWAEPTGYHSTMVGFPYDNLTGWRAIYPPDVFIGQLEKVASGFEEGIQLLLGCTKNSQLNQSESHALFVELNVAEAAAIHFKSVANQSRFVLDRDRLAKATDRTEAVPLLTGLENVLNDELKLARRLFEIQSRDSRIGFESSNQYYYVPIDLMEKIINCRQLLDHWLPQRRRQFNI